MSLLIAEDIGKNYQVGEMIIQALRGVSFKIEPASFVSFIGPSGSGKTTLLNLIGCLDTPTSGQLTVAGATSVLSSRTSTSCRC
jgi:putative ABC transport system ATP-binding protein